MWRTYLAPLPQSYVVNFSKSEVLSAASSGSAAFFRKELYLPTKIRQGWLAVASSDSFVLRVNGSKFGRMPFKKNTEPIARDIYDLTTKLQPGKNVLALEIQRNTFPEPAWVKVIGGYTTWDGRYVPIKSDTSWRANVREDNVLRTGKPLLWYQVDYDDVLWPQAKPYVRPRKESYSVRIQEWPLLYRTPPQSPWVWNSGGKDLETRMTRVLYYPSKGRGKVWLRLSALCPYRLTINGETVALRTKGEQNFDLFDLKPLMRRGENHLGLLVKRSPGQVGVLVEIFLQKASGKIEVIGGDNGWVISTGGSASIHPEPVAMAPYPSYPGTTLSQKVDTLLLPWWHTWWSGLTFLLMTGGMGLVVLGLWHLWTFFWGGPKNGDYNFALRWRLAFFHLPAGLFLGYLFFLGYDIQFAPDFPFQPWIITTGLILILTGEMIACLTLARQTEPVYSPPDIVLDTYSSPSVPYDPLPVFHHLKMESILGGPLQRLEK
ncbi:MAG: hypothetical protein PHX53_00885 [Syntrophales bacterium]|nr:hypothetical protein [Syntrophales bacterium]